MSRDSVGLSRLLPEATFLNCADVLLRQVSCDSRTLRPGQIFVAIEGATVDGHQYIPAAVTAGASAIVLQRPAPDLRVPQCVVPCAATAFARLSMACVGLSSASLECAGITGTNGKTTTSWMLHSILEAAGHRTGLVGTICNHDGCESLPAAMTTPPADQIAALLRRMRDHGTTHCVLEVSSHALQQRRCSGLQLAAAAITGLTQDHLDYHPTFEHYVAAKARIAELLYPDAPLLLNAGNQFCRRIHDQLRGRVRAILWGLDNSAAELSASIVRRTHRSQIIRLRLAQGAADCRLRLVGKHNAENALAAAGLAEQLGMTLDQIVTGLGNLAGVPGRLERIDVGQPFQVVVDYAHTPDALQNVTETLRHATPGQLICVFGAGGERDTSKRQSMGAAVERADVVVLTSDNPRNEDPHQILEDIRGGLGRQQLSEVIMDRRTAIQWAFDLAEPGDTVLIAGKGHETTQDLGTHTERFDDRDVARTLLQNPSYASFTSAIGAGSRPGVDE